MINLNSSRAFWLAGLALISYRGQSQTTFNPINDSTVARYRYEVEEYQYAEVSPGVIIADLDLLQKDDLIETRSHHLVTEGVNSNFEQFFQIENIEVKTMEDWIEIPKFQLLGSTHSYGLDSTGELIYSFPFNEEDLLKKEQVNNWYQQSGFCPVMKFFPNKRDSYVQAAVNSGAQFIEYNDEDFKLVWNDHSLLVVPSEKLIIEEFQRENESLVHETSYTLYSPYGYVINTEMVYRTATNFDNPITRVISKRYSNHTIEDPDDLIPSYLENRYIEVFPNPVGSQFEILLKGLESNQVQWVQIHDHYGNIIHTYENFTNVENVIQLDASDLPSGMFLLVVSTGQSTYSTTLTKI